MKRLSWKIPGMIAVVLTLWSFALLIASLVVSIEYEYSGEGVGVPFTFWIYSILVAILSMLFYAIDAVKCIIVAIQAIQGEKRLFHVLLAILLLCGIPMAVFVGGNPSILTSIVWNVYYFAMAVLEVVSIAICWRKGIIVNSRYESTDIQDSCPYVKDEDPIMRHSL